MPFEWTELLALLVLGLVAGAVGGLVGVGGSIVIIPVLTLIMRHNQHVAQAAAMIINFCVAAPALYRHHRAKAVRWPVVWRMLIFGLVFILVGVELSNKLPVDLLKRTFGAFLLYVMIFEIRELLNGKARAAIPATPRTGWGRLGFVGAAMGFVAGLLGIGGGPIAVPLLNRLCRLSLREAIAATSAVMCMTSFIGSIRKNIALTDLGLDPMDSLVLAACLAPTAIIGATCGASLTHILPLKWIRAAFIVLLAWAGLEMLGVITFGQPH